MRITELATMEAAPGPLLFGIEIDGDCFTPPPGLAVAAMLWKGAGPKEIDDQLVDAIVGFSLSGVEVILEIQASDQVDASYILTLAGNAGFSVSLLPPQDEETAEDWHAQLARFVEAFLTVPNFSGALMPVSGFFGYMIAERQAGVTALIPRDPYVRQRFLDPLPEAVVDAAKAAMRAAFVETVGSDEELGDLIDGLVAGLHNEAERILSGRETPAPNA